MVIVSSSVLFFGVVTSVEAALVSFTTPDQNVGIGDEVSVTVAIDSQSQVINAVSGTLNVPDMFTVQNIRNGNAHISLWAVEPTENDGIISFAGIVPGGVQYDAIRLFTIDLQASEHGTGALAFEDITVLLHDGQGTPVSVTQTELDLFVTPDGVLDTFVETVDTQKPEPFTPTRVRDENLFNNDWVVVFATQDKHSGISTYAVAESADLVLPGDYAQLTWEEGMSPYRLPSQSAANYVYVRATDYDGNVRIAVIEPESVDANHPPVSVFTILISLFVSVMALGILYIRRRV